jgi:WD40 repeat protein
VAIRELLEVVWHPHIPEILGLNIEGVVFKWSPYDDEIDELPAVATKLSVSRDGELFAIADRYGRVKLYITFTFTLLYHLGSQDAVFGLTFSPDSKRFYDIRGYYASAWEPNALMKFVGESSGNVDVRETESSGKLLEGLIVLSGAIHSVTAMAGSPTGRLYCCGTVRGVVTLHDTQHGKLADIYVSKAKFTIWHIIWSNDGKHICFTDISKQASHCHVGDAARGRDQADRRTDGCDTDGSFFEGANPSASVPT